jgi:hypothetical protein
VQSRTFAVPNSNTVVPGKTSMSAGYPSLGRDPGRRSPLKPCQPPSPVREANPNLPGDASKAKVSATGTLINNARRKSLTMETSKSLFNLSAALAKLTVKRPSLEGKSPDAESTSFACQQNGAAQPDDNRKHAVTASLPITISRIPKSTNAHGRSSLGGQSLTNLSGDRDNALGRSISSSLKGMGRDPATTSSQNILKGVIAFVDVRTAEGDDTSAVFADMLRACGGRVSLGSRDRESG